jgi:hypothetical protein
MRNCNCAGSTCGCKVTAGSGIQVSGLGTAADPFVISNTGASISAAIQVGDTSTLDLTKSGSGTNVDPIVISGNVTLLMQQLLDVSNPGGNPVAGQVPTYVGTAGADGHWEFIIPTSGGGGGGGAVSSVSGRTGDVVLTRTDVGLGNVDNTADVNKPLSTPQNTAINSAITAALVNTHLTGIPTVPTAANGTNNTQAASTAFVQAAVTIANTLVVNAGMVGYNATTASWPIRPTTSGVVSWWSTQDPAAVRPPGMLVGDAWIQHPDAP